MAREDLEIGVDEAGRGAVLGPMVMAACGLSPDSARALEEIGVADSKSFGAPERAQSKRAALSEEIRLKADWWSIEVVSPTEVDAAVRAGGLNSLERRVAEALLAGAPIWARVVLDGVKLFGPLAAHLPRAEARNHADASCLPVAAASILAKTERDRIFSSIRAAYEPRFGPILGEGYPNPATERFLEAYFDSVGALPPETRLSWAWKPVACRTAGGGSGGSMPFIFGDRNQIDKG
ncbi:MAG: hypothetical protein RBU30_00400 [Polyangia bacterium]|jgi:ribonuclease HII|nr:hypothetical protein [Polyangia bacterium]